jgi:hypothetical protein
MIEQGKATIMVMVDPANETSVERLPMYMPISVADRYARLSSRSRLGAVNAAGSSCRPDPV